MGDIVQIIESVFVAIDGFFKNYSEALTGIATVILTFVTYRLVQLGREQSNTTRAQLRAYVFIDASEIRNFGTDKPLEGWLCIKNTGTTPAYALQRSAKLFYTPFPATNFPELEWGGAKSYLAPNGEIYFGPIPLPRSLTAAENHCISEGTHTIYLLGKLKYFDTFKQERFVDFRYHCHGANLNGSTLTTRHDSEGNDSN